MTRWICATSCRLFILCATAAMLAGCMGGSDKEDNQKHTIGGTVAGLQGTVVIQNQGGDQLTLSANGPFTFATPIKTGREYAVSVVGQPSGQNCSVVHGSGIVTVDVFDIVVTCFDNSRHLLGGTISGLVGTVVLRNGSETLSVDENGEFAFLGGVPEGANYAVTVGTQPNNQTCTVANGTGTMSTSDIRDVRVTCVTNTPAGYTVGGSVSGLGAGKTLTLRLRHGGNAGTTIDVTANGSFDFDPDTVTAGEAYTVSVAAQPAGQTCTVANGSGTMPAADVDDVAVTCVNDPGPVVKYSIGGTVSGLDAGRTLNLRLRYSGNLGTTIEISANGPYDFDPVQVPAGESYVVSVAQQPFEQTCSVSNDTGTATSDVTNVDVTCTSATATTFSVGGTIEGLAAAGLVVEDGAGNRARPTAGETTFTLPEEFADGARYDVGISTQPSGQTCLITRSQGVVEGDDVTGLRLACFSGTSSPLSGTYTSPDLAADDDAHLYLTLFPDGTFIYASIENANGCGDGGNGNGVEYGVYDYDATTGAFSVRNVVVDTNGKCGAWGNGRSDLDGTLTVSGSGGSTVLTLDRNDGGTLEFTPIPSTAGQLYGSFADPYRRNVWLFLAAAGNDVYFLNTETQADPDAVATSPRAGVEYACATISGSAGSGALATNFSASCRAPAPDDDGPIDTNGTAGLSDAGGTWTYSVSGDALSSSTFDGQRVGPD